MKASEARELAAKAASVDHSDTVLERIKNAAEKGLVTVRIEAPLMTNETINKLRDLGYHFYRSGFELSRITESDIYVISW